MLLGFKVSNFRSFREPALLLLTRSGRVEGEAEGFPDPSIAPAVAIFGPNASGKSNLLRAISTMFGMIQSPTSDGDSGLPFSPYVLGEALGEFTLFEVMVRIDGVRHDYGFTYNAERILSEWLRSWPKGRQRTLFERDVNDADGWRFGDTLTGQNVALARATRPNALFLSTARLLQHDILSPIQQHLATLVRTITSENLPSLMQDTLRSLSEDPKRAGRVIKLMSRADLGVVNMTVEEDVMPDDIREAARAFYSTLMPGASPEEMDERFGLKSLAPRLRHSGAGREVAIPFSWESVGTQNFLALLGPILDRLESGGVLVVDEIDTSLHPRLVAELVRLFQSPKTNPNQAQLVLSTHDVTIMMNTGVYNVLERDQLWFVEKDFAGASELRALSEFSPRRNEVFSRNYLNGKYAAIPRIDQHAFLDLWDETGELEP